MDERRTGVARWPGRAQGTDRAWLRCGSGGVGPGGRWRRRSVAAASAAQAHAVRRPHARRRRGHDVRSRRTGVGQEPAHARLRRTVAVKGSFVDLVDLASERLGGAIVAANDEFFAPKERLILAGAALWREGEYTERGKWMDGWETRRRRDAGPDSHDWCVLRLGARGIARGVDVDTSFFKGNYPAAFALDACDLPGLPTPDQVLGAPWRELLPRTPLNGDSHNL